MAPYIDLHAILSMYPEMEEIYTNLLARTFMELTDRTKTLLRELKPKPSRFQSPLDHIAGRDAFTGEYALACIFQRCCVLSPDGKKNQERQMELVRFFLNDLHVELNLVPLLPCDVDANEYRPEIERLLRQRGARPRMEWGRRQQERARECIGDN